jgi:hypothetical protein
MEIRLRSRGLLSPVQSSLFDAIATNCGIADERTIRVGTHLNFASTPELRFDLSV